MSKIYLCGPITGCSFEEAKYGWRKQVYDSLYGHNIECLSPIRHLKSEELEVGDYKSMNPQGAKTGALSTPKGLTERDRFDTLRSDLIFCNLLGSTRPSIGSMIELGWADANRIPILLVCEDDNIHNHAMVNSLASWKVNTLKEAVIVTKQLLITSL